MTKNTCLKCVTEFEPHPSPDGSSRENPMNHAAEYAMWVMLCKSLEELSHKVAQMEVIRCK